MNGNQELEQATVVAEGRQDPCMEVPHHQCLLILAEDFRKSYLHYFVQDSPSTVNSAPFALRPISPSLLTIKIGNLIHLVGSASHLTSCNITDVAGKCLSLP